MQATYVFLNFQIVTVLKIQKKQVELILIIHIIQYKISKLSIQCVINTKMIEIFHILFFFHRKSWKSGLSFTEHISIQMFQEL